MHAMGLVSTVWYWSGLDPDSCREANAFGLLVISIWYKMRLLGLIGFPLGHSFSCDYFRQKFSREGIKDIEYRAFPLKDLKEVRKIIAENPDLIGFNVTVPYKIKIIRLLDSLDYTAGIVGAVNTVCIIRKGKRYRLKGYNTDVSGFRRLISGTADIKGSRALVLGTGGAAMAVKYVFEEKGIAVTLVSRSGKAGLLYKDLNKDIIESHKVIVNATPVGMFPEINTSPEIPYEFISKDHIAIDLVYNPAETLFLKKCGQYGATTLNGLKMLHVQADESWEIWKTL